MSLSFLPAALCVHVCACVCVSLCVCVLCVCVCVETGELGVVVLGDGGPPPVQGPVVVALFVYGEREMYVSSTPESWR